jgi:MATE family multidrug resistance protein
MGLAFGTFVFTSPLFKQYISKIGSKYFSKRRMVSMLKLGIPIGLQLILEIASFSFGAIMIGWLGAYPLAAHQIAISLAGTTYLAAGGIASAATIRISTFIGAGNFVDMRRAGYSAFMMAGIFMFTTAILFILLRFQLPLIFVREAEVIEIASGLIIIASMFQLFDGTQVVGLGALRGLKDVKIPTLTALTAYWFIGIPVGYTLAFVFEYGAYGVWIGYLTGLFFAAVLLFLRFIKVSREI